MHKVVDYDWLRSSPTDILLYPLFLIALCTAVLASGVISIIATGVVALLFGMFWRNGSARNRRWPGASAS
jgi:hypothetical protein